MMSNKVKAAIVLGAMVLFSVAAQAGMGVTIPPDTKATTAVSLK